MEIEIREQRQDDAASLAPLLRESDKREVMASGGMDALAALATSYEVSDPDMRWTALVDGQIAIMWGVCRITDEIGGMWLLGSDAILDIKRRFWAESRKHIDIMHTRYAVLTNFIDYRNLPSLSWLEALGFHPVLADPEYGYEKRLFIQYTSRRSPCASPPQS